MRPSPRATRSSIRAQDAPSSASKRSSAAAHEAAQLDLCVGGVDASGTPTPLVISLKGLVELLNGHLKLKTAAVGSTSCNFSFALRAEVGQTEAAPFVAQLQAVK